MNEVDPLEEVADAAELFLTTYHNDEGPAWTVQGSLARLQRALYEYNRGKVPRSRAAREEELRGR